MITLPITPRSNGSPSPYLYTDRLTYHSPFDKDTNKMKDTNVVEDKGFVQEDIIGAQYTEEEKKSLDKKCNRKMDLHIMPW
jgi:hypothetical protein